MNEDELPEYYLPYNDKYTGPYWSDGRFQASVSKGGPALTRLDRRSQVHDAFYHTCGSRDCLDFADAVYFQDTRHMSYIPRFIGALPQWAHRSNLRGSVKKRGERKVGVNNNKLVKYFMGNTPNVPTTYFWKDIGGGKEQKYERVWNARHEMYEERPYRQSLGKDDNGLTLYGEGETRSKEKPVDGPREQVPKPVTYNPKPASPAAANSPTMNSQQRSTYNPPSVAAEMATNTMDGPRGAFFAPPLFGKKRRKRKF